MHKKRVEVYFLSGRDTGEHGIRSRLPGMQEFYRAAVLKKFFANITKLWRGVCADDQTNGECEYAYEKRELWRRTGYAVC
jgi:hypothetical protein